MIAFTGGKAGATMIPQIHEKPIEIIYSTNEHSMDRARHHISSRTFLEQFEHDLG